MALFPFPRTAPASPAAFELSSPMQRWLRTYAHATVMQEVGALLLGAGGMPRRASAIANVHEDPARHFRLDRTQVAEALVTAIRDGQQLLGVFHSHPVGGYLPSSEDERLFDAFPGLVQVVYHIPTRTLYGYARPAGALELLVAYPGGPA